MIKQKLTSERMLAFVGVLLGLDLLLVMAHLFGGWLEAESFLWTHTFHLDSEANVPTWYSSAKLLLVTVVWGSLAYGGWLMRGKWSAVPLLVAGVFFVLAVDETAVLHEHISFIIDRLILESGDRNTTAFSETGIWPLVVGPPVLVGLLLVLWQAARQYDRRYVALALAGGAVLVGSSAGTETLLNFVPRNGPARWMYFQIAAEEGGELIAATLLVWASLGIHRGYYRLRWEPVVARPGNDGATSSAALEASPPKTATLCKAKDANSSEQQHEQAVR